MNKLQEQINIAGQGATTQCKSCSRTGGNND